MALFNLISWTWSKKINPQVLGFGLYIGQLFTSGSAS